MESLTARLRAGNVALLLFRPVSCSSSPSAAGSQEGVKLASHKRGKLRCYAKIEWEEQKISNHQQTLFSKAQKKSRKVSLWWRKNLELGGSFSDLVEGCKQMAKDAASPEACRADVKLWSTR